MPNPEAPRSSLRAWFISPSSQLLGELSGLITSHVPGSTVHQIAAYADDAELSKDLASRHPNVCFLDVTSDREQGLRILSSLQKLDGNVGVVAVLSANDPDFILRCLRQGAVDFMVPPFTADHLSAALAKMARIQGSEEAFHKEPARVYAVMPAKGACGASTIASNLAHQWKRTGAKKVLLVDLDPLAGTQSFLLKVKSTYSFMDVLLRSPGLDADLWKAMVTNSAGVDVLLAPEMMVEGINEITDAGPIFEYARRHYDAIIVDTAGVYGDWALSIARFANELLLVTTNELPALQAAQRALSYLETHRIGDWKIRLLVNRYDKEVGLNKDVIGQALHREVFHLIPSDYEGVQRALVEGKPIASSSAFGKAIGQLADKLGGKQKPEKKTSALGGLFGGLFSRTSS